MNLHIEIQANYNVSFTDDTFRAKQGQTIWSSQVVPPHFCPDRQDPFRQRGLALCNKKIRRRSRDDGLGCAEVRRRRGHGVPEVAAANARTSQQERQRTHTGLRRGSGGWLDGMQRLVETATTRTFLSVHLTEVLSLVCLVCRGSGLSLRVWFR